MVEVITNVVIADYNRISRVYLLEKNDNDL